MGFFPFAPAASGVNDFVIMPSGDTSGEADANAINGAWAAGKPVFLLPAYLAAGFGPYYINQALTPVTGSFMTGFQWWEASPADSYGAGTGAPGGAEIVMTSGFSGFYAVDMFNNGPDQFYGVDLSGFTIYGEAAPEGGGIGADGAWGACKLRGVTVLQCPWDLLHFAVDDTTGKVPDDWRVSQCKFSGGQAGGIFADDIPDSWFTDVESSSNAAWNWTLNFSPNTRLSGCKAEGSATDGGFRFGGNGNNDLVTLVNCTTQFNATDGFLFDDSAGGALGTYQLSNCVSTRDNQSSGITIAGYRSNGCLSRVMATGCFAEGAPYGAYEGTGSFGMCFTASSLAGTTAATHDDGSNTHALVNQSPVPF